MSTKVKSLSAIGAILLLALFLRTYNIFSIPIFADEAIYIRWSQVMRAVASLRFLPLSDGKQPLFMWVTIPFLKVISDPLVAGRAVSILSGLAALVGVFFLTNKLFGKKPALFASLLYAISPFSVFFDRMALVDSMLAMFGIWSLYFGVLTAQTLRLDYAMLTGFALGGAYLTKSPGIFFLALLPTTILAVRWKRDRNLNLAVIAPSLKLFSLWFVSWTIAIGMYNILRLGPEFHMLALRNKDYVYTIGEILKHPLDPLKPHLGDIKNWLWILLPATTLGAAILGIFVNLKKSWRPVLLLCAWILGPLLVEAALAKVFTARYILFTVTPMFVLAGVGAAFVSKKLRTIKTVGGLLVMPLAINFLLLTNPQKAPLPRNERAGYLEEWTAGTGIREIAKYIKSEKQKNARQNIIVGTEGFFGTLPDGLQIYLSDIPGVVVRGVGITITEVDSSLVNAKKAGDRVFLVVNSTRFKIENPEEKGLMLVYQYPKAKRPNGTQEALLLWELKVITSWSGTSTLP